MYMTYDIFTLASFLICTGFLVLVYLDFFDLKFRVHFCTCDHFLVGIDNVTDFVLRRLILACVTFCMLRNFF